MNVRLETRAMQFSLAVSVLMLVGKTLAYVLTGSVALLSDALESVVHIVATGIATFALWYTQQPADGDHPYGHGKIAYFSAGVEGALLLAAALTIFVTSVRQLVTPQPLQSLGTGLILTAVLGGINLFLGLGLVYVGKKGNSLVVHSNGLHVLSDMFTSVGVLIGLGIVSLTGYLRLDGIIGIIIGINILVMALFLLRRSFNGLMDRVDPAQLDKIQSVLDQAVRTDQLAGWHRLRSRQVDNILWVEVDFLFPGEITVRRSHGIITELEDQIQALFPKARVKITSHAEPADQQDHEEDHEEGHPPPTDPTTKINA